MIPVYIIDTSYLLVLNEIPDRFDNKDHVAEVKETMNYIKSIPRPRTYITVPVLFEYAGFIHRLMRGKKDAKYNHAAQLNKDINNSLNYSFPWAIHRHSAEYKYGTKQKHDKEQDKKKEFVLKIHDIATLSKRFVNEVHDHSFADLSIIQLAEQLKKRRKVKILTFDKDLAKHSTAH